MKRNRIVSGLLIALCPTVALATPSNQFELSNTLHGTVCSVNPDVWLLGGELKVDAPISINGTLITREGKEAPQNSLAALSGSGKEKTQHYMTEAIGCIESDDPIALVGAVASLYEKQFTTLSSVDIPAPIPEPDLPEAPEIVKDQFETKAQFEERVEKLRLQRQQEIAAIQQKYRQQVEARNAKIRALQSNIDLRKENLDDKKSQLVARAFRDVMGQPVVTTKSYDAENQQMHLLFKASNQNYQRDIVLNVPLEQAREVYNNIDQLDLALTYNYDQQQLELINISGSYQDNEFVGDVAKSQYKPEALSVVLESKADVSVPGLEMQNPNLIDSFEVDSRLSVADNTAADELKSLLANVTAAEADSSSWFFNLSIEDYANSDQVAYARNSGEIMSDVAAKVLGVPERHIYELIDRDATSGAIKDKLRLMLDNVAEGDTVYFYYSGHGIPAIPDNDPYILPQDKIPDYVTDDPFFKLDNVYKTLSSSKAGKIVVMVDSCFSGATDGVSVIKGVAASRLAPKKVSIDPERMVVITAGRDKEYSNMYQEKGHRLFSYYLMKSMIEGNRNIDTLYQQVYDQVKSASFEMGDLKRQHPTITGNQTISL
ncbi:caspase family protein [Photobacterium rosenbergii]|uniref:Caspase family protein n=1 Tax=Photobacterium rosenbergii TaxID=294936 RepID=A0ABU3ZD60_9GAMM|nr:caspase family protein [Photobacterium rosenbergii]MDV5168052.1 caspase family protein [Photobacterium rosenbergii]